MSDLTEFLAARLDEDEASARDADAAVLPGDLPRETHIVYALKDAGFGNAYQGFVLVHDPARALREVAAKRAILNYEATGNLAGLHIDGWGVWRDMIKILAAVWSGHPDYRQEWKP